MLRSFFRYLKFFAFTLFSSETRKVVFADLRRFSFGQRVISNTTINPWSGMTYSEDERAAALEKAVQWLAHSHGRMKDDGFGSYHLINKWSSSYVETSGYIIPSFINFGNHTKDDFTIKKAILAANWLIKIQKASGGWQGECVDDKRPEIVFNTGQVIRGLYAAYKYTNDGRFLDSAVRACDWLCAIQEEEGYWKKHAFMNAERVYDSYVDAPLLMIYETTGKNIYKEKAIKNLEWIIEKKQQQNGWFGDCDNTLKRNDKPILHTISYTIDGLLDCGIMLNDKRIIDAAKKSADKLFEIFSRKKFLRGRFDAQWNGSEHVITTGCAQIAIIWMKLFRLTKNIQYLNAALKMNDILIFIQDRKVKEKPDTKGAMPGSYPVWGRYEAFGFPNWATKYFTDSLLLENECLKEIQIG